MTRGQRDRRIAQAYFFGAQASYLGRIHDLTQRRVLQIVAEQRAIMGTSSPRRDALRALRRSGGSRDGGRPRDPRLVMPESEAALYRKARRYYGAAYAREMMGIGA